MGKVDELMALVLDYGRLCRDREIGLLDRRASFDAIRTSLTACVAEWRPISEAPKDQRIMAWFPDQGDAFPVIWEFGGGENRPSKPNHMRWELDDGDSACYRYGEPTLFQFIEPPQTEAETK